MQLQRRKNRPVIARQYEYTRQPGGKKLDHWSSTNQPVGQGTLVMKMGNFQTQPWYIRLAVFGAIAIPLYAGFWYFVTRGTRSDTKDLNAKIAELLPRNAQAQIAQQRLNEFRQIYKARQEEYG